ncbi:dirigent protein 23-like [Syzygium oleosum]|uniref:dirigent protein 23-like n=1 Tax=Syzygium oleosum TaxID=219896 RepID=UPI0024BAB923|nr:dirigent protein 23-like [Syzygium oleosum]
MAKLGLTAIGGGALALVAMVATATTLARAEVDDPEKVDPWFDRLSHAKRKTTRLHFYFHDTFSGKSPTAVRVAEAAMTNKSPTLFGAVIMIDDPLTEGPDPEPPLVGRAQGFYGSVGLKSMTLLMDMNLVFTSPKYNDSTLSILGRNPALKTYRELPIVGGTGVFQLASGIATAKTYFLNLTTGDAVVEYNVIARHY